MAIFLHPCFSDEVGGSDWRYQLPSKTTTPKSWTKHQSTESTEWVLAFHKHIAAVDVINWPKWSRNEWAATTNFQSATVYIKYSYFVHVLECYF